LKVAYTDEAIADIVEAITYLNERIPPLRRSSTRRSRSASNVWLIGSLTGLPHAFAQVLLSRCCRSQARQAGYARRARLVTGRSRIVEDLVRWQHQSGSFIIPASFGQRALSRSGLMMGERAYASAKGSRSSIIFSNQSAAASISAHRR
jgi:hypothetical protein